MAKCSLPKPITSRPWPSANGPAKVKLGASISPRKHFPIARHHSGTTIETRFCWRYRLIDLITEKYQGTQSRLVIFAHASAACISSLMSVRHVKRWPQQLATGVQTPGRLNGCTLCFIQQNDVALVPLYILIVQDFCIHHLAAPSMAFPALRLFQQGVNNKVAFLMEGAKLNGSRVDHFLSGWRESLISSQAISDEAVGVCCNVEPTA